MAQTISPRSFDRQPEPVAKESAKILHETNQLFEFDTEHGSTTIGGTSSTFRVEIPHEPIDEHANIIIYGFAGSATAYRGLARAMTEEQGLITVTCELSRRQRLAAALHPSHALHPMALTSKLTYDAIRQLPQYDLPTEVNIFGHSMGGKIGTELALHHPDRTNLLTLMASAGLIEHNPVSLAPAVPRLLGRIATDIIKERNFVPDIKDAAACIRHIISNPSLTIGEMLAVANCDIRPQLQQLVDVVDVAILQPEDDEFFDVTKVTAEVAGYTDNFRVLTNLGHGAPITHPSEVAQEYAQLIKDKNVPKLNVV